MSSGPEMSEPGLVKTARIERESGLYETLRYAVDRYGAEQVQRVLDTLITHPGIPRIPAGHWFCARCSSVLPDGYYHNCDDKGSHSGPSRMPESSTGATGVTEVPKDPRRWTD